jgi:hypothetical protein
MQPRHPMTCSSLRVRCVRAKPRHARSPFTHSLNVCTFCAWCRIVSSACNVLINSSHTSVTRAYPQVIHPPTHPLTHPTFRRYRRTQSSIRPKHHALINSSHTSVTRAYPQVIHPFIHSLSHPTFRRTQSSIRPKHHALINSMHTWITQVPKHVTVRHSRHAFQAEFRSVSSHSQG